MTPTTVSIQKPRGLEEFIESYIPEALERENKVDVVPGRGALRNVFDFYTEMYEHFVKSIKGSLRMGRGKFEISPGRYSWVAKDYKVPFMQMLDLNILT